MSKLRNWFFEITKTSIKKGTRLRNEDIPTQDTFKQLTESVVFKTESNDRAKLDTGAFNENTAGHVTLATDAQTRANTANPSDRALVVTPSQTTTLSVDTTVYNNPLGFFTGATISRTLNTNILTRKDYFLSLTVQFKNWLFDRLIPSGGLTGQVLKKISDTDLHFEWGSVTEGIVWNENITNVTPIIGVNLKGYVVEGAITGVIKLPNGTISSPVNGDKIGIATGPAAGATILLDNNVNYYNLISNQSIIFRYDQSLNKWLAESSHVPLIQGSSTTIYVDGFAGNGGNGSITLPYNNLISARNIVIGNGDIQNPQFLNYTIKVIAGNFTVKHQISGGLFVNTLTYDFDKTVKIIYESNALASNPTYLFDNSLGTIGSRFYIKGEGNFEFSTVGGGFIKCLGSSGIAFSSPSPSIFNQMDINFKKASITTFDTSLDTCPLVHISCVTGENTGQYCLFLNGEDIIGGKTINKGIIQILQGGSLMANLKSIQSKFTSINSPLSLAIKIDSSYIVRFINDNPCFISGQQGNKQISISGECDTIEFKNCVFGVYSGTNLGFSTHNIIKLESSYVLKNKFNGSKITGLYLTNCSTSNNNLETSPNSDPASKNIIFKVNSSGGVDNFSASIDECNFSGLIDSTKFTNQDFLLLPYSTQIIQANLSFKSNILSVDSSLGGPKSLFYYNIPISSANIPNGAVYSNNGILTIKT